MRRLTAKIIAVSMGALMLAGCGEEEAPIPAPRDTQAESKDVTSVSDELMNVLTKPQLVGGKLTLSEDSFSLELKRGGEARFDTRLRNAGDTPVTISSIETAVRAKEITFSEEGCRPGTVLQPEEACDLFVIVKDDIGRSIDNEVIIVSDAVKTPSIRVALKAEMEKIAEQPVAEKPKPKVSNIPYDQIAAINEARRMSGWGSNDALPDPEKRLVESEEQYPEGDFSETRASLPVVRKRLITEDQVIKAVLETPFNNIMCSRVIAVTDSDTWGYDQFPATDKPLLPAGTRFIGTCQAFTDEKAAIAWTRFITPDGTSARIVGGANDAMGRGGLPGELDRRWFDKYGIPVIFSSIRSSLEYMLTKGEEVTSTVTNPELGITTTTDTPESKAIDRFQGDMSKILDNIMDELQDTKAVLNIPGGTRIDIVLGQDVYFKDPYTVVGIGDDEYELPEKDRQQLYRTTPKPVVAGAEGGAVATPDGSTKVMIDGKEYWLMPARVVDKNKQASDQTQQLQPGSQQGRGAQ